MLRMAPTMAISIRVKPLSSDVARLRIGMFFFMAPPD
jgi:hypothetical protein